MAWGVLTTGFSRKKQTDVTDDLNAGVQEKFGLSANIGTSGVFGRIVGIVSSAISALWEVAEDVYNSFSPDTASGVALDNCVALTGIARKPATESTAWVVCQMQPATTIPAGNRVKVLDSSPVSMFEFDYDVVTPLATSCHGVWISCTYDVGTTYRVTVDGVSTAGIIAAGTARDTLIALATDIEAGAKKDLVRAEVMPLEDTLRIYVEPDGSQVPDAIAFAVSAVGAGGTITIDETGGIGYMTHQNTGVNEAPIGTITDIIDTVAGFESVTNLVAAEPGSLIETDAELRLRRERSIHVANGGTVDAIRTALLELDDADTVIVLENITDAIDALGVPPHCIYAIVDIPDTPSNDQDVAEVLWENKPGGIATYGTDYADVQDSQGFWHRLYFDRPTDLRLYMQVTVTQYSEEDLPEDPAQAIKDACVDFADEEYEIGKDVLPQRFYGPIFEDVSGIETINVEVRWDPIDPWVTVPLPVAWNERATLDVGDITVVGV